MNTNKINIDEITKLCNEITLLAENYRNTGDQLFEISTACTKEVISMGDDKIQEQIDEVALILKNTYLQVLTTINQIKTESIRKTRVEELD